LDSHPLLGDAWSIALPILVSIIYTNLDGKNTSFSAPIGCTPYSVMFGQDPRSHMSLLQALSSDTVINEEDLPKEIGDQLSLIRGVQCYPVNSAYK